MRFAELAQPLLDVRCIGEDPAIDGAVVDLEAALAETFLPDRGSPTDSADTRSPPARSDSLRNGVL